MNVLTRKSAVKIAVNIQTYWLERGYNVQAKAERGDRCLGSYDHCHDYYVRSDLVRGLPIGWRGGK